MKKPQADKFLEAMKTEDGEALPEPRPFLWRTVWLPDRGRSRPREHAVVCSQDSTSRWTRSTSARRGASEGPRRCRRPPRRPRKRTPPPSWRSPSQAARPRLLMARRCAACARRGCGLQDSPDLGRKDCGGVKPGWRRRKLGGQGRPDAPHHRAGAGPHSRAPRQRQRQDLPVQDAPQRGPELVLV